MKLESVEKHILTFFSMTLEILLTADDAYQSTNQAMRSRAEGQDCVAARPLEFATKAPKGL